MVERCADLTRREIDLLLVEPDFAEAERLRVMLDSAGTGPIQITQAASVEAALLKLRERSYEVVLLDLTQPDGDGLNTLLRARHAACETPIVVLAPERSEEEALQMLRVGAQDYLTREECSPLGPRTTP